MLDFQDTAGGYGGGLLMCQGFMYYRCRTQELGPAVLRSGCQGDG